MWIFLGNFWLHILSLRLIVSAVGYSQTLGCSPVLTYSYSTIVVLMSPCPKIKKRLILHPIAKKKKKKKKLLQEKNDKIPAKLLRISCSNLNCISD
uniref:Secreted protein n=1 Tax=Aegilops tauschii subsp. strangulata TaxID=200361 RepID=A0A453N540_AEGTS